MSETTAAPKADPSAPRRVKAIVALRLLEVMRDQDLPGEILEAEDPTQTMPRRLGLSDVVERQIRSYKGDVRRGVRLTDSEVFDLFRLVIRRPDSEEIFVRAGRDLADASKPGGWRRFTPRAIAYRIARRLVKRRLRRLFGRRIGGFGRGPFSIEGRSLLFIQSDPGGDACHFMVGFCETMLAHAGGTGARVTHSMCQARGDNVCRWEGVFVDSDRAPGPELERPAAS